MCFYIHPNHASVKIAKRDIPCYKILTKCNKTLKSPAMYELYFNDNQTHPVIKKVKCFNIKKLSLYGNHTISLGLHSYSAYTVAMRDIPYYESIHKSIIPKGTEYYFNPETHEYVSLKLKVWKKNIYKNK